MSHYRKPPELYDGLRLHQNENTGGCSPRVIEALARLRAGSDRILSAVRRAATAAVASYLGVPTERITLVNGLDEGIMALAVAYLRAAIGGPQLEAIVPEPAFEIFRFDTAVAGGTARAGDAAPDFSFPLDEVLAAITPNTRVVFVTNPNNPTGVGDAARGDPRRSRGACRPARSSSSTRPTPSSPASASSPSSTRFPTSSSAERSRRRSGLAGLRIGCLVGAPATLDPDPARDAGLQRERRRGGRDRRRARRSGSPATTTCGRSHESKALLYAACDRARPHVL